MGSDVWEEEGCVLDGEAPEGVFSGQQLEFFVCPDDEGTHMDMIMKN